MAKVTINTNKQLRAVKNELTKKVSVNTLKIVVLNDSLAFDVTKTVSNSLDLEVGSKVVPFGNTEMFVDNFTDSIVSVEFRPIGNKAAKREGFSKSVLFAFVGIKFDGKKTDVVSISKSGDKIFAYSFMTKKRRQVDLRELAAQSYTFYTAGAYSASEARKYTTTLYKCKNSREVEELIDELTYGALKQLKGKEMTIEELQKAAARMGQWKTGMTHTEDCEMVTAYYINKWKIGATEYADGKGYARDIKMAKVLSNEKYEVTRNATEGILVQCRPFSVNKVEVKVTNGKYIKHKILFDAKGEDNVIWLNREEITPEIQREFNKLFTKEDSKFAGKVVVIKHKHIKEDLSLVDFYTDLNGLKASYDLRLDSGFNILALDKPLKGGVVNTNMQQLESLIMADPIETKNVLTNIATAFNKSSYYSVLNAKAKVPSIKEIQQMYTAGIVKNIAPKFALQNKKIFGTIADQAVQGMVKRVRGLNYQVPGQSRIMQMDFGAEFGTLILRNGEAYAPGVKERWILATRNPKQHTGEFLLLKNLSREEVMNRIKELIKVKEFAKLLMREYRLLSDSAVVVPAIEEIKDAIGGADVDGDTLTLVFHRKLTAIIKKAIKSGRIKSTAIQVENESPKQEKDKVFGLRSIHTAFVELVNNGNLTIGEITFMNNFILGLLFDMVQGKGKEAAIEFFKFAGNNGAGTDAYLPLDRETLKDIDMNKIHVSFDEMDRVVSNIKSMELTEQNMIAALDDLNAIFMMLQMETIDAPKKGTTVPVPYEGLLNDFQQNSKTKLDIDLGIVNRDLEMQHEDQETGLVVDGYKVTNDGVKFLVEQREGWHVVGYRRNGEPIMKYFHNDVMHEIRVEIAREVMRTARTLRRRYDNAKYSEDIQQFFISAKDAAGARLVYDLLELKNLYNSINAGVSQNEEEESPFYNDYIDALANTVRLVTAHMDDVARAELVEAVSAPASTNRSTYSSFAMNTIKEEYIKMVTRNFADVNVAGERITHQENIKEGDVLEFKFGVAKDGEKFAATKENITGTFTVAKIDDKFYAVKPIEEVLPEVKFTNEIVFRASDQDLYALRQALVNAENVELKIEFGKGNLIIADGEVVGTFITNSGKSGLNKLYENSVGKVKRAMLVEERMNSGKMKEVLVVVLDCNEAPVAVDYAKLNNDGELQVDLEATQEVSDDDLF